MFNIQRFSFLFFSISAVQLTYFVLLTLYRRRKVKHIQQQSYLGAVADLVCTYFALGRPSSGKVFPYVSV